MATGIAVMLKIMELCKITETHVHCNWSLKHNVISKISDYVKEVLNKALSNKKLNNKNYFRKCNIF